MSAPDKTKDAFAGKVLAVTVRGGFHLPPIPLRDCLLQEQAGRIFLRGVSVSSLPKDLDFAAGLQRCIAWDAVESYVIFDSLDEYTQRVKKATPVMSGGFVPRDTPGLPVEPSGISVDDDTPLDIGSPVLAEWQGAWWRAEVVSLERGGKVKIHYVGWDATWDAVVPRSALQMDLSESIEED